MCNCRLLLWGLPADAAAPPVAVKLPPASMSLPPTLKMRGRRLRLLTALLGLVDVLGLVCQEPVACGPVGGKQCTLRSATTQWGGGRGALARQLCRFCAGTSCCFLCSRMRPVPKCSWTVPASAGSRGAGPPWTQSSMGAADALLGLAWGLGLGRHTDRGAHHMVSVQQPGRLAPHVFLVHAEKSHQRRDGGSYRKLRQWRGC